MSKHVAVLMGGWSVEREVSLVSGAAVADSLEAAGHKVTRIEVSPDLGSLYAALTPRPELVFNALHGRFGEDGCIQGVLEILSIPYTHSGVLASALAMDKPTAKRLFAASGIPCAKGQVMHRENVLKGGFMDPPYVVKPLNEGSSVGVHIVHDQKSNDYLGEDWPYGTHVLVEIYIPGREIHVAVMGDEALGAIEIQPHEGFYDYEAKYTEGKADHVMPAPLEKDDYAEALRLGLLAHQTLGCRGVSRTDLRFDDTGKAPGQFYVLETNTQPGMTPLSLVPEIAAYRGIGFDELVSWIMEDASCPR
ncbi:MAG: D-alanine--D-alanine ligase [Alphaproteobacteria bacterium]